MKVLHVGNIAGVASLLVEGLSRRGVEADLIVTKPHPYGFPHETVVNLPARRFLLYLLKLSPKYDVIHLHDLLYMKQFNIDVLLLSALRLFGKKVICHFHGSLLRESHNKLRVMMIFKTLNHILVSTPDLIRYCENAVWLPNPVDIEVFKPMGSRREGVLYFRHWYEPEKEDYVRKMCEDMGLKLTIITPEYPPIPYREMPKFLNKFEVFIDRFNIPSLSKTALEALACGCKVISWKGPIENPEKITRIHDLHVVTEKLLKSYKTSKIQKRDERRMI